MSDIRTRMRQAEEGEIAETVTGILDAATEADAYALEPVIPSLLRHREWVVRASALDMVGEYRLTRFADLVRARLQDKNEVVRGYALSAYYDLLGAKALPLIRKWCEARAVRLRVMALVLCYVETMESQALEKLRLILTRKRCHFGHRYVALETLDHYLNVGQHPEVVRLFQDIQRSLHGIPRSYGLDEAISRILKAAH